MKQHVLVVRASTIVATCVLATGCQVGAQEATGMNASPALLELDNGGFTTTAEQPQFGDLQMQRIAEASTTGTDDVLLESGELPADPAPPERHLYRVLAVWGHLPGAPAPTQPTDWTGGFAVDNGQLSVRRTIQFEDVDHVAPRVDPSRVDFVSHTLPFVDGLALAVRVVGNPGMLHVRSAAVTTDFDLSTVERDGEVRRAIDGANGMVLAVHEIRPGCVGGVTFGEWRRVEDNGFGVFRGRVFSGNDAPAGAIRGIFGHRQDGSPVFFGKHIDLDGHWDGLLHGTYGDSRFHGEWAERDPALRGVVGGRYFEAPVGGDDHGLFVGRWHSAACQ